MPAPGHAPRLMEIFSKALELTSAKERAAYLDRVCESDRSLRDRVEGLLGAHVEGDSFLESPASVPTMTATPGGRLSVEESGTLIGPYKLLEPIGEGGMGTVYMAEQTEPVRRRVALKVIKPGMDTKQVVARFEAERQALAMMDHPNIAKVHDAGMTPSGRPYFVMELVRGLPITEYCDREQLSIPERLELFTLVCRAVQHAHQKGIIHRDLKPSNVLVTVIDGVAVPKVIDFGVAKATGAALTERTLFTDFHHLVGTPLYMSPEQADRSGGDVDTRSDVYSLGVLLYELLTGTTPFDSETLREAAYDEMRRVIREEEPPKPSTRIGALGDTLTTVSARRRTDPRHLGPSLRGELDWIVMKALEKDRRRRYETTNDFAADVMRYLSDRPVEACPPSAWYRLRKLGRRNRVALATTGLVALTLVGGTGVSAWQAILARQARSEAFSERNNALAAQGKALDERNEARRQRERAEANFRKARDAVDRMLTRAAEDLADVPHMEQVRRALLEDALEFYRGFLEERRTDLVVTHETARAYLRVGSIYQGLGRVDQAAEPYGRAIALLEELAQRLPDLAEIRADLARCYGELAYNHFTAGRSRESIEGGRKALAVRERLVADFPTVVAYARDLARAHSALANSLTNGDGARFEEAEEHHRNALAIWRRQEREFPDRLGDRAGEAHVRHWWGALLSNTGRLEEAEAEYRRVLALREELVAAEPTPKHRLDLDHIRGYMGSLLVRTGRPEQAEPLLRQAIVAQERLRDDFPGVPDYRGRLCGLYLHLHEALLESGRIRKAEEAIRQAVAAAEELVNQFLEVRSYRGLLAYRSSCLGLVLHETGRMGEAAEAFRRAFELYEGRIRESPDDPFSLACLAEVLTTCPAPQFRDPARAVALAKRAVQHAPTLDGYWLILGAAHYRTGAWDDAIGALTRALELGHLDPVGRAKTRLYLALAHGRRGDLDRARTLYHQAADWMEQRKPHDRELRELRAEAEALLGEADPPS